MILLLSLATKFPFKALRFVLWYIPIKFFEFISEFITNIVEITFFNMVKFPFCGICDIFQIWQYRPFFKFFISFNVDIIQSFIPNSFRSDSTLFFNFS